ncbi:MAG TPA: methyltransferase domain-containing protein [Blastocatellia bacterium]|nr:methyltransferase domain-containing protein [Blastocatellia bacterium]
MLLKSLRFITTTAPKALLFCALICFALVSKQRVTPSAPFQRETRGQSARITRPTSPPYTGDLSIFEDPKRDEKLQINRVMDILGIKEGSSVADIGAGSGWFTVRAARRVGIKGIVYAVEINADYLKYIEERAATEKLTNIRTVLGKEDDPLLPPRSLDAVLILKTYHEIAEPILVMIHLRDAMRPGALMGIIDKNGNGDDHGISRRVVISEAERAGFAVVETYDFVKPDGMDYFLVLRARGATQ